MKFNKLYDDDNSVKGYECSGYYIMKYYTWMNNYSWIINKDGKSWYADCEFWKLVNSGDVVLCLNLKDAKQKVEKLLNA